MKAVTSVVLGTALLVWAVLYLLSGYSPSAETVTGADAPRDHQEVARVELVGPGAGDSSDESVSARIPGREAPAAEALTPEAAGTLALRLGPRPEGTEVVVGRLLPPRRASDEDDAPEWYVQDRVLAVSLASRDGHSPRPAPFNEEPGPLNGEKEHFKEPMTVEWKGVPPGTYDITVELRGDAGRAETQLTGIVVGRGADEQDPRLTVWDPMIDFDVMQLFVELPTEREAKSFVIGTSEGDEGLALVCKRRPFSLEDDREVHGPYYVVHGRGHLAFVHVLEEMSGEVIVPHGPHDRKVSLPKRVPAGVRGAVSPDGLDPSESSGVTLERVPPTGEWRLPIPTMYIIASHLPSPGYVIPIAVPGEGHYRWIAETGGWSSDPFEIKREGKTAVVELEVTRLP